MAFKNIILDFGGVILDIDYHAPEREFRQLGMKNFDELYSKKKQDHFFDDYEKGNISDADFRSELKKYLPPAVTDTEIDRAWNALLFSIPPQRMHFLRELKKTHRVFLLSNTNSIHVQAFTKSLEEKFGENVFETLFDKVYMSCFIHMRKPDAEIFNLVLNENKLKKEESVFIDDSIQHVEGAKRIHLPAYHLDLSKNTLEEFLPTIISK